MISSISGLYEKVFGKLLDRLVFSQRLEARKRILKEVYGYKDIEKIANKRMLWSRFSDLTKYIFRIIPENESKGGVIDKML